MSLLDGVIVQADPLDVAVSAARGQRTAEWFEQRLGMITASGFHSVMSKGRGKGNPYGEMFKKYALSVAIERHFKVPAKEQVTSYHLQRGQDAEEPALKLFTQQTNLIVEDVGFLQLEGVDADVGGSPDGMIYGTETFTVELKARAHPVDHFYTVTDGVAPANWAQVQGQMLLTDAKRAFYITYCEMLPDEHKLKWVIVERDNEYLEEFLQRMVVFREFVEANVELIKNHKNEYC